MNVENIKQQSGKSIYTVANKVLKHAKILDFYKNSTYNVFMHKSIISVKNLTKTFGNLKAVDGIDFEVPSGSFFAFLGQNGAGKSTTINILIGLLKKDSGEILFSDNQTFAEFKNKIGIVFQNNVFDDKLSVKENLQLYGTFYLPDKKSMLKRYEEIIALFGLKETEKKRFGTLSGGQKRKAEVARAMFSSPEILFLDEPTTGLDPKTRMEVWTLLHKIQKQTNMTLFLTTHYMEETINADKIVIIHKGKKVCEGSPTELKNRYSLDKIFIVPSDIAEFEKTLESRQIDFKKTADNYIISFKTAAESIDLLNQFKNNIKFFEVKKGSMDDVFLTVVGESLAEDCAK